jgi:predicted SAM-dependent methyltransferase
MTEEPIKLNLGSGDMTLDGYVNLDAKWGHRIFPLCTCYVLKEDTMWQMPDDGVDEIRASHVLEHFPHGKTQEVISDWVSQLKPGGILKIAVPDFAVIVREYLGGALETAEGYLMGGQSDEHDYHRAIFNEGGLSRMMTAAGLTNITRWTSEIADCAALPISLNLMGTKPLERPEQVPADGHRAIPESNAGRMACVDREPVRDDLLKIAAVMSVPRLAITNNMASMFRAIAECGMPCRPAQGVFWHHALTRQIEDRIAEGYDYLLAVDFDTWFLPGHVTRLIELMLHTPKADAICAVQCRREDSLPILGIHDQAGDPVHDLPRNWFERPLTQIHIAHFGLTLFRSACFARLARPWFRDEPDPNGSWREGRRDADVAFWRNFEKSGCRVFMANEVSVGHLQEICTFSGPASENWRPVHVYLKDLNAGRIPPHCAAQAATK